MYERVFDFFDAVAADHTGDLGDVWVHLRGTGEDNFKIDFVDQDLLESLFVIASKPVCIDHGLVDAKSLTEFAEI